jgi:excisionase family DNA binding protein
VNLIAVPLPDGRWLALEPAALLEGLEAARSLGLGLTAEPASGAPSGTPQEQWLTSEQLQETTGIHSTTWEAKAKSGQVPCLRVGKSLRFKLTDVEAALKAAS